MKRDEKFRLFVVVMFGLAMCWQTERLNFLTVRSAMAFEPDENSGENFFPERATDITRSKDSRWVNYDRGDQTDWLKVAVEPEEGLRVVTDIEFINVEGTILLEIFRDDPYAEPSEGHEITAPGVFHVTNPGSAPQYFKVYAVGTGSLAQYSFAYTQIAAELLQETPTPMIDPTATPELTPTPTITPEPTVTPEPTPTSSPTPTVMPELTPTPTITPEPTGTPEPTPTIAAIETPVQEAVTDPPMQPTASLELTATPTVISTSTPEPTQTIAATPTPFAEARENPRGLLSGIQASIQRLVPALSLGFVLLCAFILSVLTALALLILLIRARRRLKTEQRTETEVITPAEYKMLGDFATEQGKLPLAERCYRKVVELEPYNWAVHYDIGLFLFQTARYKEAIKEFHLYFRHDIIMPEVYAYLGYAYLMSKDLTRAEEYYRKVVDLTPHNPDGYVGLGVIAQAKSQYQQAYEHYEHALEQDSNCKEARQNIQQIQPYL